MPRRRALARSLTLLRVFLVASGAILLVGALALSWLLGRAVAAPVVANEMRHVQREADSIVRAGIVRGDRLLVSQGAPRVARELRERPGLLSVKIWSPGGRLLWTNLEPQRIGKRYAIDHHLAEALDGEAEGELESLAGDESAAEAALGIDDVIEVYAPIRGTGGEVIGAYEVYADARDVASSVAAARSTVWVGVAAIFAALYGALALLVRRASRQLRRQNEALKLRSEQLLESYRLLERSSIEAIEALNATVEAKDAYTAGHSERVQRIAVALGRRLGIGEERLRVLSIAALFHDIGKLGVPDAVLLKPGRLDPDERRIIEEHPDRGAEIVARLASLRDAVPLVRHHHERWDGRGYPVGLAAESIPLEAAIVGLADAWDAMTTHRPYRNGLSLQDAFAQLHEHRGTQFHPAVVDAFVAVARSEPAEIAPPDRVVGAVAS